MDDNTTALTESLIIWVSFLCLVLCECVAGYKETEEAFSLTWLKVAGVLTTLFTS